MTKIYHPCVCIGGTFSDRQAALLGIQGCSSTGGSMNFCMCEVIMYLYMDHGECGSLSMALQRRPSGMYVHGLIWMRMAHQEVQVQQQQQQEQEQEGGTLIV